jgi:ribonuclease P protein component
MPGSRGYPQAYPTTYPKTYPKSVRVRRRREFLALQRQGRRQHTRSFVVVQAPADGPLSRLGVTVSSRVGNAVVRNRVKRLIREIFRERRLMLPAALDIVVIARPDAAQITHAQAASELERALGVASRT